MMIKLICVIFLSVWFASMTANGEVDFFNSSGPRTVPVSHLEMIHLLDLCYSGASNPIVVTPNFVETLYKNLNNSIEFPIIIFDQIFISTDIQLFHPIHPLYILSADSIKQLEHFLRKLRFSPIWNIKSTFFVIGDVEKSCRDSVEILRLLWKFNLLSSFVVCSKTSNQTMMYTYNPHTNRGPTSWIAVEINENGNQRGMFYKTTFKNGPEICAALHFDKTQHLDGYPVKIMTTESMTDPLTSHVFPSLGMTEWVDYYDENYYYYKKPVFLLSGERDITTNLYSDYQSSEYVNTIPVVHEVSRVIVTQKRSFLFNFREVVILLDSKTLITIIGAIFFIFFLILMNNRYHINWAISNVFRLLLGMEMDFSLVRLSMKVLFFTATFFMLYFEPEIESQLFALLTRPRPYTIETLQDLYDHRYHVFFYHMDEYNFKKEKLWTTEKDMNYLHPMSSYYPRGCLEFASRNKSAACVFQTDLTVLPAIISQLHVSRHFVFKSNNFLWSRKDWVLNDRVYVRLLNVFESGFRNEMIRNYVDNHLKKQKAKDRIDKIMKYDEITDENLYYFWIFIAAWQLFGVCVFIIEYLITRFRR